ncbi:MAG: hypothetical protein RR297_05595 [Clostridia bacterium]
MNPYEIIEDSPKIDAIAVGVLVLLVGILAIYNQIALKVETDKIAPNGQKINLGDYSSPVYTEGENTSANARISFWSATVAPVYDFKPLYNLLSDEYRIAVVEKGGYGYSSFQDCNKGLIRACHDNIFRFSKEQNIRLLPTP